MKHSNKYHWIAVLSIAALMFSSMISGSASASDTAAPGKLDANAASWFATAQNDDVNTFLVVLRDEGRQVQMDQLAGVADRASRREQLKAVLTQQKGANSKSMQDFLANQGLAAEVTALTSYRVFNGFSITTTKRVVQALRQWNKVLVIELDVPIQLDEPMAGEDQPGILAYEWNISKIGADRVHSQLGINGSGVVVGGMDTGVRFTHEALSANYKCAGMTNHSTCWFDAVAGQAAPYDDNNHGTHTMGTAVGGTATNQIGVAPGARWIACKGLNGAGSGSTTGLLNCFDWFLDPGGSTANAPDVVVNSWGSTSGASTTFQNAVTTWVNAGIFPEFSNGNSGPGCNTVGSPASYTNAFGVGATDINDVIASFSSRGGSPFGGAFPGNLKPQVSAPGVNIRSSIGSSNTGYSSFNGTSMAGPHVAGLVALLLDANPNLSIAQLRSNIQNNALGISANACGSNGIPNNVYGFGRIRAFESVQAALGGGTPTRTPTTPPTVTPTPPPTQIFFDNFEGASAWTVNPNSNDTATTGQWAQANPETTTSSGTKQQGTTVSGLNDLVTGAAAGASVGANDIDGGVTSIRSPNIALTGGTNYTLTFSYYFSHLNNSSTADFFRVSIVANGVTTQVFQELGAATDDDAAFATATVNLNQFSGQTVQILIQAADAGGASLVEAAVDDVRVTR